MKSPIFYVFKLFFIVFTCKVLKVGCTPESSFWWNKLHIVLECHFDEFMVCPNELTSSRVLAVGASWIAQ